VADFTYNWGRLDDYPGLFICDLVDLPVGWGPDHTGMLVYVRDERLFYTWDGTDWGRRVPAGELKAVSVASPVSTTSTSFVVAVTASTEVPIGRSILVVAQGPSVANSNGLTDLALMRDSVSLMSWSQPGRSGSVPSYERPHPLHMSAKDRLTGTVGALTTVNYTLQFRVNTDILGTSTLGASAEAPLGITVIEV